MIDVTEKWEADGTYVFPKGKPGEAVLYALGGDEDVARLAAAAPEMLVALKLVAKAVSNPDGTDSDFEDAMFEAIETAEPLASNFLTQSSHRDVPDEKDDRRFIPITNDDGNLTVTLGGETVELGGLTLTVSPKSECPHTNATRQLDEVFCPDCGFRCDHTDPDAPGCS